MWSTQLWFGQYTLYLITPNNIKNTHQGTSPFCNGSSPEKQGILGRTGWFGIATELDIAGSGLDIINGGWVIYVNGVLTPATNKPNEGLLADYIPEKDEGKTDKGGSGGSFPTVVLGKAPNA